MKIKEIYHQDSFKDGLGKEDKIIIPVRKSQEILSISIDGDTVSMSWDTFVKLKENGSRY